MNPSILARRRGGFVALLAGLALATAVATGVVAGSEPWPGLTAGFEGMAARIGISS